MKPLYNNCCYPKKITTPRTLTFVILLITFVGIDVGHAGETLRAAHDVAVGLVHTAIFTEQRASGAAQIGIGTVPYQNRIKQEE